jgi:hypothetical protein
VVVVDVLQPECSSILGIVSDPQLGPAGPGHVHVRGHDHVSKPGVTGRLRHVLRPHSHDAADKVDAAMEASAAGIGALWISLAVLGGTAVLQAVVVVVSGSVALLGDTLHNAADALTAVPLGIAFVVGRRPPTRRYTYGYGRAEDLVGLDYWIWPGRAAGLGSSLSDVLGRLPGRSPSARLSGGAGPG